MRLLDLLSIVVGALLAGALLYEYAGAHARNQHKHRAVRPGKR